MPRMSLNADTANVEVEYGLGSHKYPAERGYIDVPDPTEARLIRQSGVASPAATVFSKAEDTGWLCCRRVWWSWTPVCPRCGRPRPTEG